MLVTQPAADVFVLMKQNVYETFGNADAKLKIIVFKDFRLPRLDLRVPLKPN